MSQPVSGLGRTWTSCPSSARPSLIISANSSAATFVLCTSDSQLFVLSDEPLLRFSNYYRFEAMD